jgi:hypothetical protein
LTSLLWGAGGFTSSLWYFYPIVIFTAYVMSYIASYRHDLTLVTCFIDCSIDGWMNSHTTGVRRDLAAWTVIVIITLIVMTIIDASGWCSECGSDSLRQFFHLRPVRFLLGVFEVAWVCMCIAIIYPDDGFIFRD